MNVFSVETNYPIAFDSYDHLVPGGVKNDNHTSTRFIDDLEKTYGVPLNFMDLGCAGGLLVHDFIKRGHLALGLEGSDYNVKHPRAEWPALHQKNLFTCDISREYSVALHKEGQKSPFLCDAITAWEVVEHIHPERLNIFFENIRKHLKIGGKFLASVSIVSDSNKYHRSVFSQEHWYNRILSPLYGLSLGEYPYSLSNAVRQDVIGSTSFMIALERVH